ncbi:serine/threonine-protein kinase [Streptomyces sp. NPDC051555]|uniref:serine/threonine-protein kinase n=1 Tax=Streptomyces sp. NPDC051555 TaxID=3365657 RepID=UPI0037B2AED0
MTRETRAGDVVGGRYQLVAPIASGGMGRVWKSSDLRLQVEVAVKELWLTGPMSPEQRATALRRAELEAFNAARLRDHPNIVTVHDVVVEHGVPWIVMQLVSGGTLQQRLQGARLAVPEAKSLAVSLLRALAAAHEQDIVHRDVKPANVMITTGGQVLLADFGIAAPETGTGLTSTGAVIGSAPYLAPERAAGQPGRASSDLFSLGVTLYEAVEGVSPFLRDSPLASAHAVRYDPYPPMHHAGPLTPLIAALLAKTPEARPTIAAALALLEDDGTRERPEPPPTEDFGPRSDRVTLDITNACPVPVQADLGVTGLGEIAGAQTASHTIEPFSARTLRVRATGLAATSCVVRPRAGHPVHITVRSEAGALHLTSDGIPDAPARPKPRPPTAGTPKAKAELHDPPAPRPSTSRARPTDKAVYIVLLALALAVLQYTTSADFSGWVSHYLNDPVASPQRGDCLFADTRRKTEEGAPATRSGHPWVKVPCWSAASQYEVLTGPLSTSDINLPILCPSGSDPLVLSVKAHVAPSTGYAGTYVCRKPN